MIDPLKITNFNASDAELEEMILFWICAAGKNGVTAARCLNNLLESIDNKACFSPFEKIKMIDESKNLPEKMKQYGIGCYRNKAITFRSICSAKMDLKSCSVDDLESIFGIGPKTARCFLIHSRPHQNFAGLDTHVLKFLRDQGHLVPKSTPTGKKYRQLEKIFLHYAKRSGKSVAEFDLEIWKHYRKNNFALK